MTVDDEEENADMVQPGAPRRHSGELETAVLAALWSAGVPMTPADVQTVVGGALARNTIATVLARLYEKDAVARSRSGRAFAYSPTQDAAGLAALRMHTELGKNGPDRRTVLARFVSQLSSDDESVLRGLLDGLPPGDSEPGGRPS